MENNSKKTLLIAFVFIALLSLFAIAMLPGIVVIGGPGISANLSGSAKLSTATLPKFTSCSALKAELESASSNQGGLVDILVAPFTLTQRSAATGKQETSMGSFGSASTDSVPHYSTTNVQVTGVDEADIVKNDGRFIYTLSKGSLVIALAYPPEKAEVLSTTKFSKFYASELFVKDDVLMVIGNSQYSLYGDSSSVSDYSSGSSDVVYSKPSYPSRYYVGSTVSVKLFDISDRSNPKQLKSFDFEGSYVTSRLVGSDSYIVVQSNPVFRDPEPVHFVGQVGESSIVPLMRIDSGTIEPVSSCTDIGYLPPVKSSQFITIARIPMSNQEESISKLTVLGQASTVFASEKNIYISYTDYSSSGGGVELLASSGSVKPLFDTREKTVTHKFSMENRGITYLGQIISPGHVLNQFSMDEFQGNFRIATTIGRLSRSGSSTSNNIYIFGEDLKLKGMLEDLAPGESIYSARFMGDKAYLVTFKKVDPLFVIDLKDSTNPKVIGKLKIPGYSDYLHPINDTLLIGIGKNAEASEEDDFAWYQGVKVALFDVSDVEHPKELSSVEIGDRGTDSYALRDHKAFLWDFRNNLLVIPITLAEIDESKYPRGVEDWAYGDFVFQGAYVYSITPTAGIVFKGRITHLDNDDSFRKSGYYFDSYGYEIQRSLYIGDYLYTVSDSRIKANSLSSLAELAVLDLVEDSGSKPSPYPE